MIIYCNDVINLLLNKQGSGSVAESLPSRGGYPVEGIIEDLQSRIKKLERWQAINTVLRNDLIYKQSYVPFF